MYRKCHKRTIQVGCNTEFTASSKADNALSDIDRQFDTQPLVSTYPYRERCSWIQIYMLLHSFLNHASFMKDCFSQD